MPTVHHPDLLAAVYDATLVHAKQAPTTPYFPGATMFRTFDQKYFVVDTHRHILRRDFAMNALILPKDNGSNRFTGNPHHKAIPLLSGLYCSLQGQAVVNEGAFYYEKGRQENASKAGLPAPTPLPRSAVLHTRAAIKIQVMGTVFAADLSPHNPGGMRFLKLLGSDPKVQSALKTARRSFSVWDEMNDGEDCSVARGIGLALASYGYEALCFQTVRTSERSPLERGDNLVFFGPPGSSVQKLSAVEAYLFPLVGEPQVYPVEF